MPTRYPGPTDAALRHSWRSERRAVLREHHPDRGGDAEVMRTRLAQIDAAYLRLEHPAPPRAPQLVRRPRRLRTLTRSVRARIPAGWPGHRRQIEL